MCTQLGGRATEALSPTLVRLMMVPSLWESAWSALSASRSARSLLSFCCVKYSAHSAARRRRSSPHLFMTDFCSSSKALCVGAGGECECPQAGMVGSTAEGGAGLTLALSSSSLSMESCWTMTFLCSSRLRCADSALDFSAATRQRSCKAQDRAEGWLPTLGAGQTVPKELGKSGFSQAKS